ncbi:MAG: hypothetical protein U1F16_09570 [Turneriella sp.]
MLNHATSRIYFSEASSVPVERDTAVMIDGEMDYADSIRLEVKPKSWFAYL